MEEEEGNMAEANGKRNKSRRKGKRSRRNRKSWRNSLSLATTFSSTFKVYLLVLSLSRPNARVPVCVYECVRVCVSVCASLECVCVFVAHLTADAAAAAMKLLTFNENIQFSIFQVLHIFTIFGRKLFAPDRTRGEVCGVSVCVCFSLCVSCAPLKCRQWKPKNL